MSQPRFDIQTAAVIGAGTMGRGIVMSLANAGVQVLWLDNNPEMLEQALGVVADTYAHNVRQGRIDEAEAAARRARIAKAADYPALVDVDLVIEAVYENLELKQKIFRELDGIVKAAGILASNTSALDIDAIAAVTKRPEQVVGLHFFSPAYGQGQRDRRQLPGLHRQPHARHLRARGADDAARRRLSPSGGRRAARLRLRHGPVPHV